MIMAADNDDAKSFKSTASRSSRFRSKLSRVFKEREKVLPQIQYLPPVNSLKLNDDVADFLRPSTANSTTLRTAPKIDIAIAQRWPTAHQIRASSGGQVTPNGFQKPRRRMGLRVGFVNGDPEFIAAGGEESEEPPIEVARRKAMKAATGSAWAEQPASWHVASYEERGEDSPKLNRTPTGHGMRQEGRPPTGYAGMQQGGAQAEAEERYNRQYERAQQERERRLNLPPPKLETRFSWEKERDGVNTAGTERSQTVSSPRDPTGFAARKKELASSEGAALRRAGALIMADFPDDDDDDEKREVVGLGMELPEQHYDVPARTDAPKVLLQVASGDPRFTLSPEYTAPPAASSSSLSIEQRDAAAHAQNESWKPAVPPRSPMRQESSRDTSPIPPHLMSEDNFKFSQMLKLSPRANGSNGSLPAAPLSPALPQGRSPHPPPQSYFSSQGSRSHSPAPSTASGTSKYFRSHLDKVGLQRETGTTSPNSFAEPGRSPSLATTASRNFSIPRQYSGQQEATLSKQSSLSVNQENALRPTSAASSASGYRSVDENSTAQSRRTAGNGIRASMMTIRSVSLGPPGSTTRPSLSPMPSIEGSPQADLAYAQFASRVAHMKGVFRLTAEKERPGEQATPSNWLRAALWWYHIGKAGLEILLKQRQEAKRGQVRELLTQPHVDLAKVWWILSDPLEQWSSIEEETPATYMSDSDVEIRQSVVFLKGHMKTLALSTSRTSLMPPRNSLIQGQDTKIWIPYPSFSRDATLALGNLAYDDYSDGGELEPLLEPLHALPLSATENVHCFGRFPVEVSVNTDDPTNDRVILPCILTMLRYKRDFGNTIVISSQSELINLRIGPWFGDEDGLTWYDVSWKNDAFGMTVRLPDGYQANVRMPDQEFRFMWNLLQYSHKVEDSLRAAKGETLIHEAPLAELQYADPTNSDTFPQEKVRTARAYVFERSKPMPGTIHERKVHIGYRLVLVTDPRHKSLAYVSHYLCFNGPLYFEFLTDSAAGGMAAMVLRIFEGSKQFRALLVFPHASSRQELIDVLNGVTNGPGEIVAGKMALSSLNIEPATQAAGFTMMPHPALEPLQWQKLGVNNQLAADVDGHHSNTIESESLRIIARHTTGCITDRINLSKGDLLLRLPCTDTPTIQIYREPQEDLIMSVDMRHSPGPVVDGITQLLHTARLQPTIRTFNFTTFQDLHAFQAAITDRHVRYDGLAAMFSISRRRMVVPIYKKWEAFRVRVQVVSYDSIVQIAFFMEDFAHTDALCFGVKSTDVFENVKGDGKSRKWAVKMVDAKFSLPHIPDNSNDEGFGMEDAKARVRRRFVNLEGLEYAEEHDDLVVGFDTQEERDRFASALPAPPTMARGITLKRRT